MNFSPLESVLCRQRCRQWTPLITQQLRLRHIYELIAYNLAVDQPHTCTFYFTLHLTSMSAPFYTSERCNGPSPKWSELDLTNLANSSTTALVVRIWQHHVNSDDKTVITWGVNLSGLVFLGNKFAIIQPGYFKTNTLIFSMQGGYFTSHHFIRSDLTRPVPFADSLNLENIDSSQDKRLEKLVGFETPANEVHASYSLEKLRKLQYLQMQIRNRTADVENVIKGINRLIGPEAEEDLKRKTSKSIVEEDSSSPSNKIRYAPQLLTMNSLYKMLQEKPTKTQKLEIVKLMKEIEISKFKTKLLGNARDKKSAHIRQLKAKLADLADENEDRNNNLMDNYHSLNKDMEKLKEVKVNLLHYTELSNFMHSQLQFRRRQLIRELLTIYPIEHVGDDKYTILGIYLPHSDVLPDSSDIGVSVSLGYVSHILVMCSSFLQVPLRYPMVHYGSRSLIYDVLPDKEREFPLFTKGKDKVHFTYGVYLLNKNIAQLRWLYSIHTDNLKATLPNLLDFLQGGKPTNLQSITDEKFASLRLNHPAIDDIKRICSVSVPDREKFVSLNSFGASPNISDPILDCLRHETFKRSSSPSSVTRNKASRGGGSPGKSLSEILAIPEAFLNKQISSSSLRNYAISDVFRNIPKEDGLVSSSLPATSTGNQSSTPLDSNCDNIVNKQDVDIEQGTDPLALPSTRNPPSSSINIQNLRKKTDRSCRSVGSYPDDTSNILRASHLELGSEPSLNIEQISDRASEENPVCHKDKALSNEELLAVAIENMAGEQWINSPNPLTARTNALLNTKSFNLVKPK